MANEDFNRIVKQEEKNKKLKYYDDILKDFENDREDSNQDLTKTKKTSTVSEDGFVRSSINAVAALPVLALASATNAIDNLNSWAYNKIGGNITKIPLVSNNLINKSSENFYKNNIVKGLTGGSIDALANATNAVDTLGVTAYNKLGGNIQKLPLVSDVGSTLKDYAYYYHDDNSVVNKATHDITEAVIGFIPALRAAKYAGVAAKTAQGVSKVVGTGAIGSAVAAGTGTVAQGAIAGAAAGAVTITPDTHNLSNLLKDFGVDNAVTNYLAIDSENDSEGEKRLKQALDTALFGAVADTAIEGVGHLIKAFKKAKVASGVEPTRLAEEFDLSAKSFKDTEEQSFVKEQSTSVKEKLRGVASEEDKKFISEVIAKENPTDEEVNKLSEILGNVDENSIKQIDELAAKNNNELISTKIDEFKSNPTLIDDAINDLKNNGVEVTDEASTLIKNTINNIDTKEATSTVKNILNSKEAGFVQKELMINLFGASAGGVTGATTIEEDDTTSEKVAKIIGGAGAGLLAVNGVKALNNFVEKKLSAKEAEIFARNNPTVSAVDQTEAIIKRPKPTPEEISTAANTSKKKDLEALSTPKAQAELTELNEKFIKGDYAKLTDADFQAERVFQNIKYVETDDDLDKILLQTYKSLEGSINKARVGGLGDASTGVRTWDEAVQASSDFKTINSVTKLFDDTYKLDSKIHAARLVLAASGSRVKSLVKEIDELEQGIKISNSGTVRGNSDLLKAKLVEFNNATEIHRGLSLKVFGASSEIGRALNIHKLVIKQEEALALDLDNILRKSGGLKAISDKVKGMQGLNHPAQIDQFIRMSSQPILNAALYARQTGLLWSPITQGINIGGNVINQGVTVVEKYTKAGYASVNNILTNKNLDYGFEEANSYLFGLGRGFKDGLIHLIKERKFGEQFYKEIAGEGFNPKAVSSSIGELGFSERNPLGQLGESIGESKYLKVLDPEQKLKNSFQYIGGAMGLNLKFMSSMDTFFQAMTFRASVAEQALRQAKSESLTGQALADRIEQLIKEPPENFTLKSGQDAQESTFQTTLDRTDGKSFVDSIANIAQNSKNVSQNSAVNFLGNVLFPFVKTPTNIIKRSFERIPGLNILAERWDQNSFRALMGSLGKEEQIEAMARFTTGGVFIGIGMQGLDSDFIKVEDKGRKILIDLGDRTIDVSKIEPIGTILGFGAYMKDALQRSAQLREVNPEQADELMGDIFTTMASSVIQYTGNKSYMKSALDFFELIDDVIAGRQKKQAISNFIDNTTASFIPFGAGLNFSRNVLDENKRQADGLIEKLMNKLPLLSDNLEPNLDMISGDSLLVDPTSGSFKQKPNTPVLDEVKRLDVRLTLPKDINGVKLDIKQSNRIIELATKEVTISGKTLNEFLSDMVDSDLYNNLPDGIGDFKSLQGTKRKQLSEILDSYYSIAEQRLISEEDTLKENLKIKEINKNSYITGGEFLRQVREQN